MQRARDLRDALEDQTAAGAVVEPSRGSSRHGRYRYSIKPILESSNDTMFAQHVMFRKTSNAFAGTYHTISVETGVDGASPHRLVAMLFEGFGDAIAQAHSAMSRREIEGKCKAITRAVRIVDEGLRANLDMAAGGKLAQDLASLYSYIAMRLTQANLNNDPAALDECASLMEPLRSAWAAIDPAVARKAQ